MLKIKIKAEKQLQKKEEKNLKKNQKENTNTNKQKEISEIVIFSQRRNVQEQNVPYGSYY